MGFVDSLQKKQSGLCIEGTVQSTTGVERTKHGQRKLGLLLQGEGKDVRPNIIEVILHDLWADAMCFLEVGDKISCDRFEIDVTNDPFKPFCAIVTDSSEIAVIRSRTITVNALNVGSFIFQNEDTRVRQASNTTPHEVKLEGHNQFFKMGQYYDVVFGNVGDFNAAGTFVLRLLAQRSACNVLDVACGTGLFSFFLRYYDLKVTGLDSSHVLLDIAKEKLRFQLETEPSPKPATRFLLADMTTFEVEKENYVAPKPTKTVAKTDAELNEDAANANTNANAAEDNTNTIITKDTTKSDKRKRRGEERDDDATATNLFGAKKDRQQQLQRDNNNTATATTELLTTTHEDDSDIDDADSIEEPEVSPWDHLEQFDGAICIDSLRYLPSIEAVRLAIRRIWFHLEQKGMLIVDIPNVHVQGAFRTKQEVFSYKISSTSLAISAAQIDEGTLDVIKRTYNAVDHKRRIEYMASALQKSQQKEHYLASFEESCEDLLVPPAEFEAILKEEMFDIQSMFGDLNGGSYNPRTSERRVYLCLRRDLM